MAAVCERAGLATTTIALVRRVAERVRPPRALAVPFPFGAPLGAPNDEHTHLAVLRAALALLAEPGPPPVIRAYLRQSM